MIPSQLVPFANHLWQSTLFAGVAGLLTLSLRKNRARVRYWLWLMASVKFLLPFSVLVALGGLLGRHTAAAVAPSGLVPAAEFSSFVGQLGDPFTTTVPLYATAAQHPYTGVIVGVLIFIWGIGFVTLVCRWTMRWRRMRASVRKASPLDLPIGLPVKSSPAFGEPGVFGIFRPVLLLPDKIVDCLSAREMESIVAHELCHVRRRDNLATVIHMAVEVVFWFHPLVWWLGARLMEEREQACDEEVLRNGGEPRVYAEGILKICELYLASPLACVAGVTGGDLKRRIEAIMANRATYRLNIGRRLLLAAAGLSAVAGPVLIGVLNAPQSRAQSNPGALTFEVSSIKPADPNARQNGIGVQPGGNFRAVNVSLNQLITWAYNIRCGKDCDNYVSGGPGWASSQRFDLLAKPAQPEAITDRRVLQDQARQKLRVLLTERFQLRIRQETKQMPAYALVVMKNGHKLKEVTGEGPGGVSGGAGDMTAERARIDLLVLNLAMITGRPVLDRTGLTGTYDFKLKYAPEVGGAAKGPAVLDDKPGVPVASDPAGPSIFEALQDQLGLKLEATRGPVESIVIIKAERPTAN